MDAAKIRILLEADGTQLAAGFSRAAREVLSFEQGVGASLKRIGSSFSNLSTGQKAVLGLGAGLTVLVAGIKAVVGPAIEFESAFAGVLKTVDGTPAQLSAIRKGILDMASVMPAAASELAGIAENAGQLGIAAPDVLEFTRTVAMLGETTDLSFDEASTSLARFLNITGNDVPVSRLADIIVDLGNNSAATESEILNFATRLASAATVAGASEDEILALSAAFVSMGVRAEAGGTAAGQVLTRINDAVLESNDNLTTFAQVSGVTVDRFREIAEQSPVEAFVLFAKGLNEAREAGVALGPILEDLELGGIRQQEVARLAALNTDLLVASLIRAEAQLAEGGAAATEYEKRVQTVAAQLEILRGKLDVIAIRVGTPLLGFLSDGAKLAGQAVEELTGALGPLASSLADLGGTAASGIGSLLSNLGGPTAQVAVTTLGLVSDTAATAVGALNSLGPAGLVVAALAADIALVGPVSVTAQKALVAWNAAAVASTASTGGLSVAMRTLLASINPVAAAIAIATAGFVLLQREVAEAEAAGKSAAEVFAGDLRTAIDSQNFDGLATSIDEARGRMEELEETATRGWLQDLLADVQGQRPGGIFDQLFGGAETAAEQTARARGEYETLLEVIDDPRISTYSNRIRLLGENFDVTEDEILAVARATGTLNDLYTPGVDSLERLNQALRLYKEELLDLSDISDEAAQRFATGTQSLADMAELLGVSERELGNFAAGLDEIDFDKLFSDDDAERVEELNRLMGVFLETVTPIAEALGIAEEAVLGLLNANDRLIASMSDLRAAVDETNAVLAAMEQQQQITGEAQERFNTAIEAFKESGTPETFEELVRASRDYRLEQLALTGDVEEYNRLSDQQYRQLLDLAEGYGLAEADARALLETMFEIPEEQIIRVAMEAEQAKAEVAFLEERVRLLEEERFIRMRLEDEATPVAERVFLTLQLGINQANQERLILGAVDEATPVVERVWDQFRQFASGTYDGQITGTDAGATTLLQRVWGVFTSFENDSHDGKVTATDSGATTLIQRVWNLATSYESDRHDGKLTATDSGASSLIQRVWSLAQGYDGTYTARLQVVGAAAAASAIRAASAAAASFGGTRTLNLVTARSTVTRNFAGGTTASLPNAANGGIFGVYADGGFGGIPERPGRATIYQPAYPYRIHSEPETGGEAYIPMGAGKRTQAMPVLFEVLRRFGMFADGGLSGVPRAGSGVSGHGLGQQVVVQVPMTVQVPAGSDPRGYERAVRRVVRDELAGAVARGIEQVRIY